MELNEAQIKDSKECESLAEKGEDKECIGCSCNVCLMQTSFAEPTKTEYTNEVKLIYFKRTGTYYAEGTYKTENEWMFEILDEVKQMKEEKRLPGIGGSDWIIFVDGSNLENGYPLLIL